MSSKISIKRILVALCVPLVLLIGAAWYFGVFGMAAPQRPANSILIISPYRHDGTWVFDDERVGLVREPFVAGVPEMIDYLVADIPNAEDGFRMLFSARPFPGYQEKLIWDRKQSQGNYYRLEDPPMEGWLCPALFKYFAEAPKEIYVKAEAKEDSPVGK